MAWYKVKYLAEVNDLTDQFPEKFRDTVSEKKHFSDACKHLKDGQGYQQGRSARQELKEWSLSLSDHYNGFDSKKDPTYMVSLWLSFLWKLSAYSMCHEVFCSLIEDISKEHWAAMYA